MRINRIEQNLKSFGNYPAANINNKDLLVSLPKLIIATPEQ